jgi:uncharacterized protein (TIGR03435 family)
MKLRLIAALTLISAMCSSLIAQDLTGTWQGTLKTPAAALRIVFKFTRAADGQLTGQLFSIDQSSPAIPMNGITVQGSQIRWAVPAVNASYEGTFATGGNGINGTFTQGGPLPLDLVRATAETAWAIPEPPPPPKPMDPAANPGIEVSTIKLSSAPPGGRLYTMRGAQMMAINVTVMNSLTFAYDLHERQVSGGPSWMNSERFEIVIKPDTPGQPNIRQMKVLMQKVLAERFQLKFHNEKRELSVYAITAPTGTKHKLTPTAVQGNLPSLAYPRRGLLPARNATMTDLAQSMQGAVLDRPVVNQTNIEGRYDFTLDWMPDEFQFASFGAQPPMPDNGKPNIFQAFQDQLGLKLESTKAPAEVMVIDKLEKPSDN